MRQKIYSKTDQRYWLQPGKLKKWERSANYSMYVQHKGKRRSFALNTPNKDAAAAKAAAICKEMGMNGMDATLAKHRPKIAKASEIATVGAWIEAAREVTSAKGSTFEDYARCLRLITSEILEIRKSNKRFNPRKGGGHNAYRAHADAASLEILTLPAIQKWRLSYVAKGKTELQKASRKTSCNSTIRQARSLFSTKIIKFLPHLRLPEPIPFSDVEFYPRSDSRYHSKIDAQAIVEAAQSELAKDYPDAFLILLLGLGVGLRKGEMDTLCWEQIDFNKGLIRVENTAEGGIKTAESRGEVSIDPVLLLILRRYQSYTKSKFVVGGDHQTKKNQRRCYRAEVAFDKLTEWLRGKGVKANKPIHELRKELGAIITQEHGIYAASRVLRHSSPETTARHYSDIKILPAANIGRWLQPENIIPIELGKNVAC